jgi:hypothetical protein
MIKRGMQNDEQEALGLMDQLRKAEERAAELDGAYKEVRRRCRPRRSKISTVLQGLPARYYGQAMPGRFAMRDRIVAVGVVTGTFRRSGGVPRLLS